MRKWPDIEQARCIGTFNRNLLASYSHNFGSGWGLTISAPLDQRNHEHQHNHHGAKITET
ncbi:MAG: hypothetical protein H7176_08165 [Bdellovibrionales bacterium]|nr:hypothetical protein [Massilia sp.]